MQPASASVRMSSTEAPGGRTRGNTFETRSASLRCRSRSRTTRRRGTGCPRSPGRTTRRRRTERRPASVEPRCPGLHESRPRRCGCSSPRSDHRSCPSKWRRQLRRRNWSSEAARSDTRGVADRSGPAAPCQAGGRRTSDQGRWQRAAQLRGTFEVDTTQRPSAWRRIHLQLRRALVAEASSHDCSMSRAIRSTSNMSA